MFSRLLYVSIMQWRIVSCKRWSGFRLNYLTYTISIIYVNNPEIKSKQSKKITCRAFSTFKTGLTADFGQIWIFEKYVPQLLETWNFVWSIAGGQLEHPQSFRWK